MGLCLFRNTGTASVDSSIVQVPLEKGRVTGPPLAGDSVLETSQHIAFVMYSIVRRPLQGTEEFQGSSTKPSPKSFFLPLWEDMEQKTS